MVVKDTEGGLSHMVAYALDSGISQILFHSGSLKFLLSCVTYLVRPILGSFKGHVLISNLYQLQDVFLSEFKDTLQGNGSLLYDDVHFMCGKLVTVTFIG